jgi:hypothetical protein
LILTGHEPRLLAALHGCSFRFGAELELFLRLSPLRLIPDQPFGASRKSAGGLSRRHMLAGLAVLPMVAAAAATPLEADPVFAAIAAARDFQQTTERAYARLSDLYGEAEQRFGSAHEQWDARRDFIESFIGDEDEYTDSYALPLWD